MYTHGAKFSHHLSDFLNVWHCKMFSKMDQRVKVGFIFLCPLSVPFSSLRVTPKAWDAVDHAAGSCLCATDACGACFCRRVRPHTPHEVHSAHDEGAYWTSVSRGQRTLCW